MRELGAFDYKNITFKVVDDSYMDGFILYTALTPIQLGGDFQAAEIKYSIQSSKGR